MEAFSFTTIAAPAEGLYKEKGSKFLSFAYPVADADEIDERLAFLKKKFFDARHHCYAWVLGPAKNQSRAFDGGEPNHSAGDPILGQIRSKNLTNVLIVVVRYFGGVKLGVGGLVSAYKLAAQEALMNAQMLEVEVTFRISVEYPYEGTAEVMKLVREFDMKVVRQDYGATCTMVLELSLRMKRQLEEKVALLKALGSEARWEIGGVG